MKEIKLLVSQIDDELSDVKKYIKSATAYKGINDNMFSLYVKLAKAEMEHALMIHDIAVSEIEKQRRVMDQQGKEIPAYMLETWQEEHAEYIEETGRYKYELEILSR